MKRKIADRAEQIFLVLFGILLLMITGICLAKPQHNLIPMRMLVFTLVWMIILYFGRYVIVCFCSWVQRKQKEKLFNILLVLFFAIWGVLLFVTGCVARSYPHTDFENVYRAADALARKAEVDNWLYFSRCTNNRFPMLFLSNLLGIGYKIGLPDAYYFVLVYQVICVIITAMCLCYLAGNAETKKSRENSLTILMLLVLFTPIWGNIAFFYTDQLSFGYSIIAYTLIHLAIHKYSDSKWKYFLVVLSGIIWALAFQIKVTTIIPLLAVTIILFIRRKYRNNIKLIMLFGIAFALTLTAGVLRVRALPCEEYVERDSEPVLYWVALGLNGDGSYAANQEFAIQCAAADSKIERVQIVNEKIRKDWKQFFDAEHIVAKVRCNFACGDVGASGYMSSPYRSENIVYKWISWDGKYFWKYACLSTSYLFAIFLLVAIGAFYGTFCKKMNATIMSSYVAVFGITLFLMLWEAQNKQLFNQTGWLLLAAGYGLQLIDDRGRHFVKALGNRGESNGRSKENASAGVYQGTRSE